MTCDAEQKAKEYEAAAAERRQMAEEVDFDHPSTVAALAYAEGYLAAINDCERADVPELIKERGAAVVECAFHKARADIAERKLQEWKAERAVDVVKPVAKPEDRP